jgi:hypothetical protein
MAAYSVGGVRSEGHGTHTLDPAPQRRFRALARLAAVSGLSAGLIACSPAPGSPNPRTALDQYTAALESGRTQDAYALLSAEAKRSVSYQAFERMTRDNPGEVRALVEALKRPTAPPYVTAKVTTPDGESLLLVYEDGAWRVDASAVDLYGQTTPEQAVRSFVRAYENKRYDILLRFVPSAHQEGLNAQKLKQAWEGEQKAEMDQLASALLVGLEEGGKVELLGERATLAYGTSGTVELVREHGLWKIEDFQ